MLLSKPFAGLTLCLLLAGKVYAEEKLVFAIDVIRHGDRSPAHDYPDSAQQWPDGLGELTPLGMNQEYELGVSLRAIYIDQYHLLPEHYSTGLVYVRSSDFDRTLESAQALLLGLYPPGSGPLLDNNEPALPYASQLFPIHTVPQSEDSLLVPFNDPKEYYALLQQYIFDTPDWKAKTASLAPKFPAWSAATGMSITSLYELAAVADVLFVKHIHHLALPPDLSDDDVAEIIGAGQWAMIYAYKDIHVASAMGKNLLDDIAARLATASENKSASKYVLYSAHDNTLLSEMRLLNAPVEEVPHYASDLTFLLFEVKPATYVVKIRYNGQDVALPDCGKVECPLNQFLTIVKG